MLVIVSPLTIIRVKRVESVGSTDAPVDIPAAQFVKITVPKFKKGSYGNPGSSTIHSTLIP
jgi:hypothetical protein